MIPRPWGFRLGGAPHKVDLLRRPANLYKTPAKPQMYARTHTHKHTNGTSARSIHNRVQFLLLKFFS